MTTLTNKALYSANLSYGAEDFRAIMQSLWSTQGVLDSSMFGVTQAGTPAMSVVVGAGQAVIEDSRGTDLTKMVLLTHTTASTTLSIATADPSNPRIDRVILRCQQQEMGDGSDESSVEVLTGTPAGSPSAPSVPDGAISLATVSVGAAVTSILTANITDTRSYAVAYSGSRVFIRAASTDSRTSTTTLSNDAELSLALTPGTWRIAGRVHFSTGASAGGTSAQLAYSGASSSESSMMVLSPKSGTGALYARESSATTFAACGVNGAAFPMVMEVEATIVVTASGNLTFQWSQSVSDATATVRDAGSWLSAEKY